MPDSEFDFQQHGALARSQRANPATFEARHSTVLPPWAARYAEWLVMKVATEGRQRHQNDGFYATTVERRVKLQSLTGCEWTTGSVKALERRPDFVELRDKLASINGEAILLRLRANGYRYIEILENSVEQLHKNEDYKTAGELSHKVLSGLVPKQPDTVVAQQITVNISAKQREGSDEPYIPVETNASE